MNLKYCSVTGMSTGLIYAGSLINKTAPSSATKTKNRPRGSESEMASRWRCFPAGRVHEYEVIQHLTSRGQY